MAKFKSILYTLEDISGGKKKVFKAYVTAPNGQTAIVFGDSKKEIESGIEGFLDDENSKKSQKQLLAKRVALR